MVTDDVLWDFRGKRFYLGKGSERVQKGVLELSLYTRYILPLILAYLRDFVGSVADHLNKASHNLFASGGGLASTF